MNANPSTSLATTLARNPASRTNIPTIMIKMAAVFDIGLALTANLRVL